MTGIWIGRSGKTRDWQVRPMRSSVGFKRGFQNRCKRMVGGADRENIGNSSHITIRKFASAVWRELVQKKTIGTALFVVSIALCDLSGAQSSAAPPKKHLLVIGEEKGYRHEAVSHVMAIMERLGTESGLWDTTLRTDSEALTKKKLEYNAKNLNDFDAVLFFTGAILKWTPSRRPTSFRSSTTMARDLSECTARPLLSWTGRNMET